MKKLLFYTVFVLMLLLTGVFYHIEANSNLYGNGYQKVFVDNVSSFKNTSTPKKIEDFRSLKYGFSVSVEEHSDLHQEIAFQVRFSDGSYSEMYFIHHGDAVFMSNEEGGMSNESEEVRDNHIVMISELYLFDDGFDQILFYFTGEKDFHLSTVPFEDSGQKQTTQIEEDETHFETVYTEKLFNSLGMDIITREEWGGANVTLWEPQVKKVDRIVVHHTATTVDLDDPSKTVRAIYEDHRYRCSDNNGRAPNNCDYDFTWTDIGYNYLIDPYGNIYEGRRGGNGSVGAHAIPNSGSIGIAMMGYYSDSLPTDSALNSLEKLIGMLTHLNNLHDGSDELPHIYGHRDFQNTACPGQKLYDYIDNIRINSAKFGISNELKTIQRRTELIEERSVLSDGDEYYRFVLTLNEAELDGRILEKMGTRSRGAIIAQRANNSFLYKVNYEALSQFLMQTYLVAGGFSIESVVSGSSTEFAFRRPIDIELESKTMYHTNLSGVTLPNRDDSLKATSQRYFSDSITYVETETVDNKYRYLNSVPIILLIGLGIIIFSKRRGFKIPLI